MHAAFHTLHAEASWAALSLARAVASGGLSPTEFGDEMAALLEDAHTRAVVIGRTHAGDTAPEEADDRLFAEGVVDGESEFLAGFVDDLAAGRYEENGAGVERRARQYIDRVTGTANQTFVLALSETTHLYWILGSHENNCPECPKLALGSPYLPSEVRQNPGDGSTTCVMSCRCAWRTSTGKHGFTIPG